MERRHHADFAKPGVVAPPPAAELQNAFARLQELLCRGAAEDDEEIRVDERDLPLDEGTADLRLLRRRRAVAGRPPGDDVGDVGARSVEPDRGDHAVEELAGAADEGEALQVLLDPRRFADEHHPRLRVAVGEDEVRCGEAEIAAFERLKRRAERVERLGRGGRLARRHDRCLRRDGEVRRLGGTLGRRRRRTMLARRARLRFLGVGGAGAPRASRFWAASSACARDNAKRSTGVSDSVTSTPASA